MSGTPRVFPDNWGIPESGNGVPDILDEIKYELDWMLRMQMANGSVCNRVAVTAVCRQFAAERRDHRPLLHRPDELGHGHRGRPISPMAPGCSPPTPASTPATATTLQTAADECLELAHRPIPT